MSAGLGVGAGVGVAPAVGDGAGVTIMGEADASGATVATMTGGPATALLQAIVRELDVRGSENVSAMEVSPAGQPGSLATVAEVVTAPLMPLAWPALSRKIVKGTLPSFVSLTSPLEIIGAMGAFFKAPAAVGRPE